MKHLNDRIAEAVMSIAAKQPEAFNILLGFFEERRHAAAKSAANSTDSVFQNKCLGAWQVWDELSRIDEAAEAARKNKQHGHAERQGPMQ